MSFVMDNLGLGNIDISPLKQSIIGNYDMVSVRKNKEDLDSLHQRYKTVVKGNTLANELLQNFMQVSLDNHKLLDDNLKLNNLNVDLEKTIYNLNLDIDGMKTKLGFFNEYQKNNKEM